MKLRTFLQVKWTKFAYLPELFIQNILEPKISGTDDVTTPVIRTTAILVSLMGGN
jgi:hypothetical protein